MQMKNLNLKFIQMFNWDVLIYITTKMQQTIKQFTLKRISRTNNIKLTRIRLYSMRCYDEFYYCFKLVTFTFIIRNKINNIFTWFKLQGAKISSSLMQSFSFKNEAMIMLPAFIFFLCSVKCNQFFLLCWWWW